MNFRPSWLKSLVSLVAGSLLGFFVYYLLGGGINCFTCKTLENCYCPSVPHPLWFILGFIVLIYVVWSLIQKR